MILFVVLPQVLLFLYVGLGRSKAINRTIDDTNGDSITFAVPSYTPIGLWNQGNSCSGCNIHTPLINISRTFDATWHDATYKSKGSSAEAVISFTFIGTAVYVYNIIVNHVTDTTTFTNLTFHLDGVLVGRYMHIADDTSDVSYSVPVYANASLENMQHEMEIRAGGAQESLILFDYAEYTVQEDEEGDKGPAPPSTPLPTTTAVQMQVPASSKPSVAEVIVATTITFFVLAAAGGLSFRALRRRLRSKKALPPPPPYDVLFGPGAPASPTFAPSFHCLPSPTSFPGRPAPASSVVLECAETSRWRIPPDIRGQAHIATRCRVCAEGDSSFAAATLVGSGAEASSPGGKEMHASSTGGSVGIELGETGTATGVEETRAAAMLSEMRELVREMGVLHTELAVREGRLGGADVLPTYTEVLGRAGRIAGPQESLLRAGSTDRHEGCLTESSAGVGARRS